MDENRALKDLISAFPHVSKRWLAAAHTDQDANMISNHLLDGTYDPPGTTGDDSMLDVFERVEQQQPSAAAAPAAAAAAAEPRRSARIRKRSEQTDDDEAVEIPRDAASPSDRERTLLRRLFGGAKRRRLATVEEEEEGAKLSELKDEKEGKKKKKKKRGIPKDTSSSKCEEEPLVEEEEAKELTRMAQLVDMNKFTQLQSFFPEVSLGWLLRHADYSEERVFEIVNGGGADRKLAERADGQGVTTIIKTALAGRKTFECSVCFGDYEEYLAIECVFVENRENVNAGREEEEEEDTRKGRETRHQFCAECVSGHAKAAVEQPVIVAAGVGLKCMDPDCKNILLRAHIEQVLDARTRAVIDPMMNEEALLAADCEDVEKCQKCSFGAVIMETCDVRPVFKCHNPDCGHKHCRKCGWSWNKKHKGKRCEELDPEGIRKRVEEKLTEATMFRCPRCKKPIVKLEGCNKIACPCGQLSCYMCKKAIKNYKHFQRKPFPDGRPPTKCLQWEDPTAKMEAERARVLNEQIPTRRHQLQPQ